MKALNLVRNPYTSLAFNIAYALGNCIIGFSTHSWWFITVGAYYTVLAITRFSVLQVKRKASGSYDTELFARRITGILLVVLSFCIIGVNIMSAVKDRGTAKINARVFSGYEGSGNLITKHFYRDSSMDCCTVSRNQSDWRKIYRYG